MTRFSECFKAAAGNEPYPYQSEFATRNDLPAGAEANWVRLADLETSCNTKTAYVEGLGYGR